MREKLAYLAYNRCRGGCGDSISGVAQELQPVLPQTLNEEVARRFGRYLSEGQGIQGGEGAGEDIMKEVVLTLLRRPLLWLAGCVGECETVPIAAMVQEAVRAHCARLPWPGASLPVSMYGWAGRDLTSIWRGKWCGRYLSTS